MVEIKIDIDRKGKKVINSFRFRYAYLVRYFKEFKNAKKSIVYTKKGYHIRINTDAQLTDYEIIIIQMVLMSDWLRELRNYKRVKSCDIYWNLLFKTKIKNGKIQHERKCNIKI
jgi:hypothetical protein